MVSADDTITVNKFPKIKVNAANKKLFGIRLFEATAMSGGKGLLNQGLIGRCINPQDNGSTTVKVLPAPT
jgi:hypothetical protein